MADWLAIVAKDHKKWVRLVKSLGEYNYPEDIVQTSYEVLYKYADPKKIIKNNKVSEGYMFFTLRSVLYQYWNAKKKVQKVSIDQYTLQIPDKNNKEENLAFHKLCTMIDNEMNTWHWYDKKLTQIYRDTGLSIRKIAKQSGISWVSIFNTLKNTKTKLKNKFYEDYEDWKNGDFERI